MNIGVVGAKVVDYTTHVAQTHSDSEEEEEEIDCPLGEPQALPRQNPTADPGMSASHNMPVLENQVQDTPMPSSDSEGELPTLGPLQRRQLKRAEQRRYFLRTRGREGSTKSP